MVISLCFHVIFFVLMMVVKDSPIMFNDKAVIKSMIPGKKICHQAPVDITNSPMERSDPHSGVGAGIPTPKKHKLDTVIRILA